MNFDFNDFNESPTLRKSRCCVNGCFLNNSSNAHAPYLLTKMILRNFILLRAFTVYTGNLRRFEIISKHSEWVSCTEISLTSPEIMWMLIIKLPHTKIKFYPEMKSQTGLSSLWVSCNHAVRFSIFYVIIKRVPIVTNFKQPTYQKI